MEKSNQSSTFDVFARKKEQNDNELLTVNDVPEETFAYDSKLLGVDQDTTPVQQKKADEEIHQKVEKKEEIQQVEPKAVQAAEAMTAVDSGHSVSESAIQRKKEESVQAVNDKITEVDSSDQALVQKKEEEVQLKSNVGTEAKGDLPNEVQQKMEGSFGADFSNVNIHENSASATDMGALAYTQGNNVHFAPGQYNPDTQKGQELIGHELTHVVQQRQGRVQGTQNKGGLNINDDSSLEAEADVMGKKAAEGKAVSQVSSADDGLQFKKPAKIKIEPITSIEIYPEAKKIYVTTQSGISYSENWFSEELPEGTFVITGQTLYANDKQYSIVPIPGGPIWQLLQHNSQSISTFIFKGKLGGGEGNGEGDGKGDGSGKQDGSSQISNKSSSQNQSSTDHQKSSDAKRSGLDYIPNKDKTVKDFKNIPELIESLPPELKAKISELEIDKKLVEGELDPDLTVQDVALLVERMVAAKKVQDAAKDFGIELNDEKAQPPIVNRPVRGEIYAPTDPKHYIEGMNAKFMFKIFDNVTTAFRVPWIVIRWRLTRFNQEGKDELVSSNFNQFIPHKAPGIIDDHAFDPYLEKEGSYTLEAIVDHNFFLPNHFVKHFVVQTYDDVRDEYNNDEKGKVDEESKKESDFDSKTKEWKGGVIDEKGTAQLSPKHRAEKLNIQISKYEALLTELKKHPEGGNQALITALSAKIGELKETRKDIESNAKSFQIKCWGSFISRTQGFSSHKLDLACWFKFYPYNMAGERYQGTLRDVSGLMPDAATAIHATGKTYEEMMQSFFAAMYTRFPLGELTFDFQDYTPYNETVLPQTTFTQWRRDTDTNVKFLQRTVFNEKVSMAVNIGTAFLSAFPPTAPFGIAISIAYNTADTSLNYYSKSTAGTLRTSDHIQVGLLALDIIPAMGAAKKSLQLGTKAMHLIDAAQYAGNAYVMTDEAYKQIHDLKMGKIAELYSVKQALEAELAKHPADLAKIKQLRSSFDKIKEEVQGATEKVITDLVISQGITLMSTTAAAKLGKSMGHGHSEAGSPGQGAKSPEGQKVQEGQKKWVNQGLTLEAVADGTSPVKANNSYPKELETHIPKEYRGKVPVVISDGATDKVKVTYKKSWGRIYDIQVEVGAAHKNNPEFITLHLQTAMEMQKYSGISGMVYSLDVKCRELVGRYVSQVKKNPPVGSEAWEAYLEVGKLNQGVDTYLGKVIKAAKDGDHAGLEEFKKHVQELSEQLHKYEKIVAQFEADVYLIESKKGKGSIDGQLTVTKEKPKVHTEYLMEADGVTPRKGADGKKIRNPDFYGPLEIGEKRHYKDASGKESTAERISHDRTKLEATVDASDTTRGNYQTKGSPKPDDPTFPIGRKGFEALHALGPLMGVENNQGILWGPFALNRYLQQHGIEGFIAALRRGNNVTPGQKLKIEVIVERQRGSDKYPGADFLKSISYKISVDGQPSKKLRVDFDVKHPDNPKSEIDISFGEDKSVTWNLGKMMQEADAKKRTAAKRRALEKKINDSSTSESEKQIAKEKLKEIEEADSKTPIAAEHSLATMHNTDQVSKQAYALVRSIVQDGKGKPQSERQIRYMIARLIYSDYKKIKERGHITKNDIDNLLDLYKEYVQRYLPGSAPSTFLKGFENLSEGDLIVGHKFAEPVQQKKGNVASTNQSNFHTLTGAISPNTYMPPDVSAQMEGAFNTSFASVNIQKNSSQASALGARAFTQGENIHFAPGEYNPQSQSGKELLGHELTHVVQQRQGRVQGLQNKEGIAVNDDVGLEHEADVMGRKAARGQQVMETNLGGEIQRKGVVQKAAHESGCDCSNCTGMVQRKLATSKSAVQKKDGEPQNIIIQVPKKFDRMRIYENGSDKVLFTVNSWKNGEHLRTWTDQNPKPGSYNLKFFDSEDKLVSTKCIDIKSGKGPVKLVPIYVPEKGGNKQLLKYHDNSKNEAIKESIRSTLKENNPYQDYLGTMFEISNNNAALRDPSDNYSLIKYKKGDSDIPKKTVKGTEVEDESYIGKLRTIKNGTKALIDDVYIEKASSKTGQDKLKYVHFRGYGWTSVDNIKGGLKNFSVGVSKAVKPVSSKKGFYTVAVKDAVLLKEGSRYLPFDDGRKTESGTEVEVVNSFSGYAENNTLKKYSKVKYKEGSSEKTIFTSKGNLSTTSHDKKKPKVRKVVNANAIERRAVSSYVPSGEAPLALGKFVVADGASVKKSTGEYIQVFEADKEGNEYKKGKSLGWTNVLNLYEGFNTDLKGENATWGQVIPDERYDRAKGKDTEGTAKFMGNHDMIQIVDSQGKIEHVAKKMWPSLKRMLDAGSSVGSGLLINTGFRHWDYQQAMVDDPRFAANPCGFSSHQIGIAVDLNNKTDTTNGGLNDWMNRNAYKYGFVRTYKKYKEGHHWEYRPGEVTKPQKVEINGKQYMKYKYATFDSESKNIWDRNHVLDEIK